MLTRPRGHMHTDKHARSCVCTVCSHAYVCAHMCTCGMLVCMHMHGQVCVLTRAHSMLAHSHACTQSALTPITHRQAYVFTRAHSMLARARVCTRITYRHTHTWRALPASPESGLSPAPREPGALGLVPEATPPRASCSGQRPRRGRPRGWPGSWDPGGQSGCSAGSLGLQRKHAQATPALSVRVCI